jgi:hypothetical protein
VDEHNFYEGVKEIDVFREYTKLIYEIPRNTFMGRIRINNEDVILGLMDAVRLHQNIITDHLLKTFRYQNYKWDFVLCLIDHIFSSVL